jgi:formate hydrogenlyase subunit 6/NADH:ubiquinone oxidoreductase subunit I
MNAVRKNGALKYLADVYAGVASTLIGMAVTGRWAFKKPVTELYPHTKYVPSDRYRGVLFNKIEDCTGCMACARACPVNCIHIQTSRRDPEDQTTASDGTPIKLWTTQFDIDMALCMECGLCTEVCPTFCLVVTKQYELATTTKDDMYLRFAVDAERAAAAAKRSAEKKAAEAAAKAAAEATAGAAEAQPAAREETAK